MAKGLKRESYGFIFGFNTFLALLFQTVLTLCVTDGVGLALDPQSQVYMKPKITISTDFNVRVVIVQDIRWLFRCAGNDFFGYGSVQYLST